MQSDFGTTKLLVFGVLGHLLPHQEDEVKTKRNNNFKFQLENIVKTCASSSIHKDNLSQFKPILGEDWEATNRGVSKLLSLRLRMNCPSS